MSPGTVGITGAGGFLGWHAKCALFTQGIPWVGADRSTFADPVLLDEFVSQCDVILHIAGVNRANDDAAITDGNMGLASALAESLDRTGSNAHVAYANSIKAGQPGVYGEAKAKAADILRANAQARSAGFGNVLLPHLFGEFGRPRYNSAVTTFAHELAHGEASQVNEGTLELLHVEDAVHALLDSVVDGATTESRPPGRVITVPDAYAMLQRFADSYVRASGTLPLIRDRFELRMFNTLRSQMWPASYPMPLTRHADHRGAFFEVVRAWGQGQTSISTTVPGVIRGEHYHLEKIERFVVVSGEASIRVRRLFTDEVAEFPVSGLDPQVIDMPPLCTHDITNTGSSELVTLFWSHDHFDPENHDTYPLKVVGEELPA